MQESGCRLKEFLVCSAIFYVFSRLTYVAVCTIMDAGPLRVGVNVDIQRTDGKYFCWLSGMIHKVAQPHLQGDILVSG